MISAPTPAENVQKMNGLVDHGSAVDAQVCAVFPESSVQSGKDVAAHVGIAAEVLLDSVGSTTDRLATVGRAAFHGLGDGPIERANFESVRQVADFRELRRKVSIDKDEPAARARHAKGFDLSGGDGNAVFGCALKRSLCQGSKICEAPILVVSGGESLGVETLPRVLRAVGAATAGRAPAARRSIRQTLQDMYSAFQLPSPLRSRLPFLLFLCSCALLCSYAQSRRNTRLSSAVSRVFELQGQLGPA